MSLKRKLALGFFGALALAFLLLHTSPVERAIFGKLKSIASEYGYTIDARKFDLNLFALKVSIQGLTVVGDPIDLAVEQVIVNAGSGVLLGNLDFDEVAVRDGLAKLLPLPQAEPVAQPDQPAQPITLPPISLGKASFSQLRLVLPSGEQELNLGLEDIALAYEQSRINGAFRFPATTAAGRDLPALKADFQARTETFQTFEDIKVELTSNQSSIDINGSISENWAPLFNLNAQIGPDLLPEQPLELSATINEERFAAEVNAETSLNDQPLPLFLETSFDYRAQPLAVPLNIKAGDLATAQINLAYGDGDLTGDFTIDGGVPALKQLAPLPELEGVQVTGGFAVPEGNADLATADIIVNITGNPQLQLNGTWRNGRFDFSGTGAPLPHASLQVTGTYENILHLEIEGAIPDPDGLSLYADLPAELCAGPILFSAVAGSDFKNWTIHDARFRALNLSFGPHFQDDVYLALWGDVNTLQGAAFVSSLNHEDDLASFNLDVKNRYWDVLNLNVNSTEFPFELPIGPISVRALAEASGSGPIQNPNLKGVFLTVVDKNDPAALIESPFEYADDELHLSAISVRGGQGSITGAARLRVQPDLYWRTNLRVDTTPVPGFTPLLPLELPRLALDINGDSNRLSAQLAVPDQIYEVISAPLYLDTEEGLIADIEPGTGRLQGSLPEMNISGLNLSDLSVTSHNERLTFTAAYRLDDPERIKTALCDYWPEDISIAQAEGVVQVDTDFAFEDLRSVLAIDIADGVFQTETFSAQNAIILHDETIQIAPFEASFAGGNFKISQATQDQARLAYANHPVPEKIDIALDVAIDWQEPARLTEFLDQVIPEDLKLEPFEAQVQLFSNFDLKDPAIAFYSENLGLSYWDNPIRATQVRGALHKGIWLQPFPLEIVNLKADVRPIDNGFRVYLNPTVEDIGNWYEQVAGDATFDATLDWDNSEGAPRISAALEQKSGRLVHIDPWLSISDWKFAMSMDSQGVINIEEGSGAVNGGSVNMNGTVTGTEYGWDVFIKGFADQVQLDVADAHVNITSALEWNAGPRQNQLNSTIFVNRSHLNPDLNLRSLVESFIDSVPELYFPDPSLEAIDIQIAVLTDEQNPIIVDTDMLYMEMGIPSLVIKGNMAEPKVHSGVINIFEGSTLDLGKQTFVFKDGQILYHEDRPDDPYLDLTMESSDFQNKQIITINGYLSGLGESLGENDLTDIIATYLISNVISFVSLENVSTGALYESGATAVASQRLGRKILARYSYPLFQPELQRAELIFGPVNHNFFSLQDQKGVPGGSILHTRRFGFAGERPERIRKVVINPEGTPKWVKRKLTLTRDDYYSNTQWRRAQLNLRRRLKGMGYLDPTITHTFEKGVLQLDVDFGVKTELEVLGLELTEDERKRILERVYNTDESGLRDIAARLEGMAVTRGHPSAGASVTFEDNKIHAYVYRSNAIPNLVLDFGEANNLLLPLYASRDARLNFLGLHFSSPSAAQDQIRARLAAQGYLKPTLTEGDFTDINRFELPVSLGPRALLHSVFDSKNIIESPHVEKPFDYGVIEKVRIDLEKTNPRNMVFTIVPRRIDRNVALEVRRTLLEDPRIHELDIINDGKISTKKIRRFLRFKTDMRQSELIRSQRELTEDGPFRNARLQTQGEETLLLLNERNRYDANLQFTWDDLNGFGSAFQIRDHHFLGGINNLTANIRRNELEEGLLALARFRRVWGSRVDFTAGMEWENQLEEGAPLLKPGDYYSGDQLEFTTGETTTGLNWGLIFPLTTRSKFSAGIFWENFATETRTVPADPYEVEPTPLPDPDPADIINARNELDSIGFRMAWLYQRLDSLTDPRNGVFSAISLERRFSSPKGGDGDAQSTRITARLSTFKSWGRLLWAQRFEWGRYDLDNPARPENLEDSLFFLLGGSFNVRGFSRNWLGPISLDTQQPLGGEAMAYFSQEFTYDIGYQGLGVSPFVDGGWVWEKFEDQFEDPLVITGGLGLVWNSPVGYFRVDWGKPISKSTFDNMLLFFDDPYTDEDESAVLRGKALSEWSFRFGRIF